MIFLKSVNSQLLVDISLEKGKVSSVEKAEIYAEGRFQWEAIETTKNKNNIILYILVDFGHCFKYFLYIYIYKNSFNPHNIL